MYTHGSVANSQIMLAEISKCGATARTRIRVESDTVKHLKAFRTISSKISNSLLILS